MFFLKDDVWYFAYPMSESLYRKRTDVILQNTEDGSSFYMWGKSNKDYYMYYRPSFRGSIFQSILSLAEKHINELR